MTKRGCIMEIVQAKSGVNNLFLCNHFIKICVQKGLAVNETKRMFEVADISNMWGATVVSGDSISTVAGSDQSYCGLIIDQHSTTGSIHRDGGNDEVNEFLCSNAVFFLALDAVVEVEEDKDDDGNCDVQENDDVEEIAESKDDESIQQPTVECNKTTDADIQKKDGWVKTLC